MSGSRTDLAEGGLGGAGFLGGALATLSILPSRISTQSICLRERTVDTKKITREREGSKDEGWWGGDTFFDRV